MSKLSKLLGNSKEYKIGGETFTIYPLKVSDFPLLSKLNNKETQGEALQELLRITLMRAVPEATKEEVDAISLTYLNEMVDAVLDINGLKGQVDTKNLTGA